MADFGRSIHRAASRPAVPRRRPPERLIAAAEAGLLTRSNTAPGTAGRQAADHVEYRRRESGRPPGVTAREYAGHERAAVRERTAVSVLVGDPPRWIVLDGLSRADRRRAARYDGLVGNLVRGRLRPATFRARVRTWRPIAGYRFLADPSAVLALLDERRQSGDELFVYRGRRW